jgi:hypothetical protein
MTAGATMKSEMQAGLEFLAAASVFCLLLAILSAF